MLVMMLDQKDTARGLERAVCRENAVSRPRIRPFESGIQALFYSHPADYSNHVEGYLSYEKITPHISITFLCKANEQNVQIRFYAPVTAE